MLSVWIVLMFSIIIISNWLLISLLLLEIITFYIILIISVFISSLLVSDFLVLVFFSVFVIEGVVGLAGLIILVRFSGSDYLNSSSVLKC